MSQGPATISTTPAQRSSPKATSVAATNVSSSPTTVTWFGVKGTRPSADIKASALRRTHASNRVVNKALFLSLRLQSRGEPCRLASFFVDLDHLRSDGIPGIPSRLLMSVGAHATAQLGIPGQDDQGRTELGPSLRADCQAVAAGLEDRHVARDLGRDHRQARSHRFQEHDAKALGARR